MISIVEIRDPRPFAQLRACAAAEGQRIIARLDDEWTSGRLRFDREGEILLGAFEGEALVGTGGISRDPYGPQPGLGRVRHLYVRPELRRRGIGTQLMVALIAHARGHFAALRLRSQPAAAGLYERLGFVAAEAPEQTHRLTL